jgi:hypothetical protein
MPRLRPIPCALLALLILAGTASAAPATARRATPRAPAAGPRPAVKGGGADTVAAAPGVQPAAAPGSAMATAPRGGSAVADSGMTLRGGQEGTVFRTLTVEGEDRVHVEFERPALELALDPAQVPGLDLGTARDVLDRTLPDLVTPLLATSTAGGSPYLARPWLQQFGTGAVVRFRPETRDVESWRLIVVDSKGQTVRSFEGRGRPPQEIAWDGRSADGSTAVPGLTYSYAFEASDRAGNRRNVVGKGFGVNAFSFDTPQGPVLTFSGRLLGAGGRGEGRDAPSEIVLEAASRLNQSPAGRGPLRVTVSARSREQAADLAGRVVQGLGALTPGDPARLLADDRVEPDAPVDGVIRIAPVQAK